ncbi:MAG: hypothetical protein E7F12_06115, partial [Clostridioides difficile]|nr:hypothetical protein [Clostridioides difficile]
ILTKWYVNNTLKTNVFSIRDCFILTKWYVNLVNANKQHSTINSFILTMRYVNRVSDKIFKHVKYVFYINYEVCKSYT